MCCGAGAVDDERLRCCSKARRGHPKVIKSRSEATSFIRKTKSSNSSETSRRPAARMAKSYIEKKKNLKLRPDTHTHTFSLDWRKRKYPTAAASHGSNNLASITKGTRYAIQCIHWHKYKKNFLIHVHFTHFYLLCLFFSSIPRFSNCPPVWDSTPFRPRKSPRAYSTSVTKIPFPSFLLLLDSQMCFLSFLSLFF